MLPLLKSYLDVIQRIGDGLEAARAALRHDGQQLQQVAPHVVAARVDRTPLRTHATRLYAHGPSARSAPASKYTKYLHVLPHTIDCRTNASAGPLELRDFFAWEHGPAPSF